MIDELERLYTTGGQAAYFGEVVSQLEHALQCAYLAEQSGARQALIAAALLHDVGHLVHGHSEDIANRGIDARHEKAGSAWLAARFIDAVSEPVRLHVDTKRYLCATDPSYTARLSPSSLQSLDLQGGQFDAESVAVFEANPYFREAVMLRGWDDEAKVPGLIVPEFRHYREVLVRVLRG